MRKKIYTQLAIIILVLFSLTGCSEIDVFKPQPRRAFQVKPFASDGWLTGDTQTRGEMAGDLQKYETVESMRGKNQAELLEILGSPDKKTTGRCCYVRSTDEVEVWLYKIESPEIEGRKLSDNDAVMVFFSRNDSTVMELTTGSMSEKPGYFPAIG